MRRKKIILNNKAYFLDVSYYDNNNICLILNNKNDFIEVTKDIPLNLIYPSAVLQSNLINDNIIRIFKKKHIIKSVNCEFTYDNVSYPTVTLNTGVLKEYDAKGIYNLNEKVKGGGFNG